MLNEIEESRCFIFLLQVHHTNTDCYNSDANNMPLNTQQVGDSIYSKTTNCYCALLFYSHPPSQLKVELPS